MKPHYQSARIEEKGIGSSSSTSRPGQVKGLTLDIKLVSRREFSSCVKSVSVIWWLVSTLMRFKGLPTGAAEAGEVLAARILGEKFQA